MDQIETKYFGPMAYQADAVFEFPLGLPGFETERSFVFLERQDTSPLLFMQSASTRDLCFLLLPVLAVDPEYCLKLSPEDLAALRLPDEAEPEIGKDVLCAALVCAAESSSQNPTVNLLAPIVVNLKERIGLQPILSESGYAHKRPVFTAPEPAPCL